MAVTQLRTPQIRDSQITTAKVANSAISTVKIIDSNITTAKLAASAITSAKVANGAVTTVKILDSNVTSAKVANGAITTVKILDSNVTTAKLANESVTGSKILDSTITSTELADSSVTTRKMANLNVTTAKLGDGSVTATKIAANAVITAKILDSNVTTGKLANGSVTTVKIADSNVTTAKLADGAVSSAKIKDSTITLSGLVVIGNTVLQGTTTWVNSTTLSVRDNMIEVGSGATGASAVSTESGMNVDRGSSSDARIYYDEQDDVWKIDQGTGTGDPIATGGSVGTDVYNELKTAGSGTTLTSVVLNNAPDAATSLRVYFNGQRWNAGGGNDYTLSGSTVTLIAASLIGGEDVILCDYHY